MSGSVWVAALQTWLVVASGPVVAEPDEDGSKPGAGSSADDPGEAADRGAPDSPSGSPEAAPPERPAETPSAVEAEAAPTAAPSPADGSAADLPDATAGESGGEGGESAGADGEPAGAGGEPTGDEDGEPAGAGGEPTGDEDGEPAGAAQPDAGAASPTTDTPESSPDPQAGAGPGSAQPDARWTPLPPPPPGVDPSRIAEGPWRGRGWFTGGIDLTVPLGGDRPAGSGVVAGLGRITVGYRVLPWLGLATGFASWVHQAEDRVGPDDFGERIEVRDYGRIYMFDVASVRMFVPVHRRIEPFVDLGAGVGIYGPPFRSDVVAAGSGTLALGMEAWLGPTFSLTLGTRYRLLAIERTVGHMLQLGLGVTVHW